MSISDYLSALFYPLRMQLQLFCFSVGASSNALLEAVGGVLYLGESPATCRSDAQQKLHAAHENFAADPSQPFEKLCHNLDLNPFERYLLTFALAVELDTTFLAAVSLINGSKPLSLSLAVKIYATSEAQVYNLKIAWLKRLGTMRILFNNLPESLGKAELALNNDVQSYILGISQFMHQPAPFTLEDIVLPPQSKQALVDACNLVKYRETVYDKWGFGKKVAYNKGVSILFSGPPGTGKTMSALILSNMLQMRLHKADLSSLVSKYIGETEKNLSSIFDYAQKSSSILFFDEADAVFGKRGEQKDSHDKYANLQTSYLLQKFEEYDGVVILSSNFVQNFDPAFFRRISIKVDFHMPTPSEREQIWKSLLIQTAPFDDDIDVEFLSERFELSGAAIKNIALQAAFMAAAKGTKITMNEIIRALIAEYAKTDKIVSALDLGEYNE